MEVFTNSQKFQETLDGLKDGDIGVLYLSATWCKLCAQMTSRWKAWMEGTGENVKFWSVDIGGLQDDDDDDLSITEYIGLSPEVPQVNVYERELGLSVIAHTMNGVLEIEKRLPAILAAAAAGTTTEA